MVDGVKSKKRSAIWQKKEAHQFFFFFFLFVKEKGSPNLAVLLPFMLKWNKEKKGLLAAQNDT